MKKPPAGGASGFGQIHQTTNEDMLAHQTTLFEEIPSTWTGSDDWETAIWLAKVLAGRGHGRILEPAAGTGQIAQFLPSGSVCVELNAARVEIGKTRAPQCHWYLGDTTTPAMQGVIGKFDSIIANPPFSCGMEFLSMTANLLNRNGLAHFLLPSAYFQSQERGMDLYRLTRRTGLKILKITQIVGRVAYLKNGIPYEERQCYDSIFTLSFDDTTIDFLFAE